MAASFSVFPVKVERWRSLVQKVAPDLPQNILLAIIRNESRGNPGVAAKAKAKEAPEPLRAGGSILFNRALGLMQIIPRNVAARWEAQKTPAIYYEDLRGKSQTDAKKQILFGSEILRGTLLFMHKWDPVLFPWPKGPATDSQIKLALAGYAYGQGRVKKKIDILRNQGSPITIEEIEKHWPNWGRPKNNPLGYVKKIYAMIKKYGNDDGPTPDPIPIPLPTTKEGAGALVLVAAIIGVLWAMTKRG